MTALRIPMWQADELVPLVKILQAVGDNCYAWRLNECDGIGILPGGQSMQVFADTVRQSPVTMSWTQLLHFAESMEQTWDCNLVALDKVIERLSQQSGRGGPESHLMVEAFDSSEWIVRAADDSVLMQISARLDRQHISYRFDPSE